MSHEHAHGHAHAHGHQGHHGGGAANSHAELAGFLAGLRERPRRVLDLGCGGGADAVFLAEQGIEAVGLDMSTDALAVARERALRHGVEVEWLQGDVLDVPLADGSIDLALDRGCLHHVPPAQHAQYASEVARVLRPGGTLLIREMNRADHGQLAVSEAGLRTMIADTLLRMRSISSYDKSADERTIRTLLAVFERTD